MRRGKFPIIRFAVSACLLGGGLRAATTVTTAFRCDPSHSRIVVLLQSPFDACTSELQAFSPTITFDPAGQVAAGRLEFRIADLKTGREHRDRALLDWEEANRFPLAEFRLQALTPASTGHWLAHGQLALHGHTHTLSFPVSFIADHGRCAFDGEAVLDTRDFGLPPLKLLGVFRVESLVRIRFHVQGWKD